MLADMPFVDGKVADPEFMQGAPYEPPINVFVRGDDLADAAARHQRDPGEGPAAPGRRRHQQQPRVSGQPEVVARINRSLAADLGFSVGSVASQLRGMVEGIVPTRLRDGDREHDIRVRLAPEYRNDPAAVLRDAALFARRRRRCARATSSQFAPAVGPSNIDREQRRRQAKIGIDLAPRLRARRRHRGGREGRGVGIRCRRSSNGASPATSR